MPWKRGPPGMLRKLPMLLLAVWAALAASSPACMAQAVFPTASRIGLTPPGDLKPSKSFVGFEDPDRKVTIGILQLPITAYEGLERSVFAQNQVGLTNVKRESFPFQSGIGFLVTGDAENNGAKVRRWFLTATGFRPEFGDLAMLIRVEVPDAASAVYSDAVIRKALASVTFRTPPIEEQLSVLPFKVKDLAGFRVLKALGTAGLILIDGPGEDIVINPYVVITVGRGAPEKPEDRAEFARNLLQSAPLRDIRVTFVDSIRIAGWPGIEVRANAMGYDGKPLALVQWLRFGGGDGFLRIVGAVHQQNWDQFFPRFREVRDGVEVK